MRSCSMHIQLHTAKQADSAQVKKKDQAGQSCVTYQMLHAGMYQVLWGAASSHAGAARWRRAIGCSISGQSELCKGAQGCPPQVGPLSPQKWHSGAGEHTRGETGYEGWDHPELLTAILKKA